MMRIYLTTEISEEIIIENTKVNKIRNVLRMSKGDEIEVFNGKGVSYIAKINSISSKKIVLNFVKYLSQNLNSSRPKIHLAISMVKPSRFEIAIEKTTEIGVDQILPTVTKNTNKIYTKINSNRLKRWENIAISAAEQCGSNIIPEFSSLTDIYKLSKDFSDSRSLKIFFNENNNNLKKNIKEISSYSNILILIGPEGGFSNDEIEFLEGDIRDKKFVEKACKNIDSVCHLAFINGTKFFYELPELVLEVGVKGIMNVIDSCIDNEVPEIILASSSEVYQSPKEIPTNEKAPLIIPDLLNPRYSYGGGKIISELLAVNYGRKYFERVTIFRPHNVYGPDMGWEHVIPEFILRMMELSQKTERVIDFPIQGSGSETRAFIYIDDFMDGLMKVIDKGEHLSVYHIGTSEEISLSGLAEEIAKVFKKRIRLVPGQKAKGGTLRRCPDIKKLIEFGFAPKYSLEKGLKKTTDWYINNENLRKID